ncbi:MAG: hypothetical protein HYZ49_15705 [Chloroflexi bacterium]|nr:hypothetical protein [Chloroflexota bacterium]
MKPTIYISPWKVTLVLALLTAGLIAATIVGLLMGGRLLIFNVDGERNISAWFSSTILLAASALLAIIALAMKAENNRYTFHWGLLSLIFLYLSLDETSVIHEKLNDLGRILPDYKFLHFAWVLPATIMLIILAAIYFKFVVDLPSQTRLLFIVAGCFFVGGALGVEILTGYYLEFSQRKDLIYSIFTVFEEGFEMIGVVIFIHALIMHLEAHVKYVQLGFGRQVLEKTAP